MHAIETRDLTKHYKKFWSLKKVSALENLNLTVPTGSVFGFLGLNGAGKTTTIKLLLGLSYPSAGSGAVLGQPLGDVKAKEKIGFLPEEAYYQKHLTAIDFLNFCGKTLHLERGVRKKRIAEMLELVSMQDKGHQKLSQFSKGMLQRVGVAQALLNDPDLVIFDEPLTGLDPKGRSQLKDIMKKLKDAGKTVFFSSHILSDVQEICDHVAILNRGQLIFQGSISELVEVDQRSIRVSNLPVKYLEKLENLSESMGKEGDIWSFEASSEEQKAKILQFLHKNDLKEESILISYKELEPIFLEKIEANNREREPVAIEGS